MSPASELKIGPFSGGINKYSDGSAIEDNEMVDCVNFDIDLDGSLKSRAPWSLLYADQGLVADTGQPSCRQHILGTFEWGGARFIIYLTDFYNDGNDDFQAYIYYVDGINAGTTVFLADGKYSRAVRYTNDIYLIPDINTMHGGVKYDIATGVTTDVTTMPTGYSAAVYKDRLWISGRRNVVAAENNVSGGNSRLFFSNLGNFSTWTSSDFFDINPGDGAAVQELAVYQDNLLIFKDDATYVLAYDTQPTASVLQVINSTIGVQGPHTIVSYENSIFLQMHNQVYEMSNYDFVLVSLKVPFDFDETVPDTAPYGSDLQGWKWPITLSQVGDKLVSRFYNRLYVYHIRLQSWTRYESADTNIQYIGPIFELDSTNAGPVRGWRSYVATSALTYSMDVAGYQGGEVNEWFNYEKIFYMEDRYESSYEEEGDFLNPSPVEIDAYMWSKIYDIGVSHRFKRLFHWGVDVITGRDVTGTLYPYSLEYKVTWAQLALYTWSQLHTWGYPLFEIPATTQVQPIETGVYRRFIRFPRALRFRLLQFKVEMVTSGNTSDGPARLYSLTAFISSNQLVPKAVN